MKIIVDTREQLPLFKGKNVINKKLSEGDYSIEGLEDKIVIERKSPGDLYGSIIQGHKRFLDEIIRSRLQGKKFYIVVECLEDEFYSKMWQGGYYCKVKGNVLAKIVFTIQEKYGVIFIWCKGRPEVKAKVKDLLVINYKLYNNINIKL